MGYCRKYEGNQYLHALKAAVIVYSVDCWVDVDYNLLVEIFLFWFWWGEKRLKALQPACSLLRSSFFGEEISKSLQFSPIFLRKISWSPQKQLKIILKIPRYSIFIPLKRISSIQSLFFMKLIKEFPWWNSISV